MNDDLLTTLDPASIALTDAEQRCADDLLESIVSTGTPSVRPRSWARWVAPAAASALVVAGIAATLTFTRPLVATPAGSPGAPGLTADVTPSPAGAADGEALAKACRALLARAEDQTPYNGRVDQLAVLMAERQDAWGGRRPAAPEDQAGGHL